MTLCALLLAPAARADEAGAPLSEQSRLRVERIEVRGNTVLPPESLRALLAEYEGRELLVEELEDLRQRLTQLYVGAGYVNSGAVIPDQSLSDGRLRIDVTEGRLTQLQFPGAHHYREGYLRSRLEPVSRGPLNLQRLQEQMQLLLQDGTAAQLNAEILPGEAPGEAILRLGLREGPRFRFGLDVANDRPVSVGEVGGDATLAARNLLGIGDASALAFGLSEGYESYGLQTSLPLPGTPLSLFGNVARNDSSVVESAFRALDITSRETAAEVGLGWKLHHDLQQSLALSSSMFYSRSRTYLLGVPFSFTPGVIDGRSQVAGMRLALDWTRRTPQQVFAARSIVDWGLDAFGSTIQDRPKLPDSRFVLWQTQMQYLRQFRQGDTQWILRGGWQLSSDALLPASRLVVGGVDTVRGYRENFLVRDEGLTASTELRQLLFRQRVPGLSQDASDGAVAGALFVDYGRARDNEGGGISLASVGAGLRWSLSPEINAQVYQGVPLLQDDFEGSSLQDDGLHFHVEYGLRF